MNRTMKALLASAVLLPGLALAEGDGLSYSYVEAGYGNLDFDDVNVDGDGFLLGGSLAVAQNWHAFVDFTKADLDFDVDFTRWKVGGGYNHSIADKTDLIARASYVKYELDGAGGASVDEDGIGLSVGLRSQVIDALELEGSIDYVDLGDSDDTTFVFGGRYAFTPAFSLGARVESGDDFTGYALVGRFNFK